MPAGTRTINIVDVGRLLLDPTLRPPIKAIFIYNHNPLIVHPDQNRMRQALERDDLFIAGCDVVMTDSLAYADVVLPAASTSSTTSCSAYGRHWLQRAEPVIPRQGQALPNTEIFRRLAAPSGFDDPAFPATDADLMDDALDAADARLAGQRPSRLPTDRAHKMTIQGEEMMLFRNVRPATPSGKVELASGYLESRFGAAADLAASGAAPPADPHLARLRRAHHLDVRRSARGQAGASAGDASRGRRGPRPPFRPARACVERPGRSALPLLVTDGDPAGRRLLAQGAWLKTSDNGQTISALCPAHHADIAGGAATTTPAWRWQRSTAETAAMTQLYDEIGRGYRTYRRPDPHIAAAIARPWVRRTPWSTSAPGPAPTSPLTVTSSPWSRPGR